jgi:outer membrane protein insertion porin family/translocation and assembly module TamA
VRNRSTAALLKYAAICGLLVASSAAEAQLRCSETSADTLIRTVRFEGNETFTDDELALHVVSTPTDKSRRWFDKRLIPAGAVLGGIIGASTGDGAEDRAKRGGVFGLVGGVLGYGLSRIGGNARCLRPGTLSGDILNLSGFYRDEGFRDVRVDTATSVDGAWVDVTFKVVEGQPVLVDSLLIVGFDTTTMGALPATLNSRKGARYSPTLTQADVDTLETRLHDNGYPEGHVERDVQFASTYSTTVKFNVTPGPRARIGTVTIDQSGLEGRPKSIDESVVRSLMRFGPGNLYSERLLFETEQRFYRVGTFLSAEVAPVLSHVQQDSLVDVRVILVEDLMHSGSLEPALGTLDCGRLRGSYGNKAFLGGINRLDVSGSVSKLGLSQETRWRALKDVCSSIARWLGTTVDTTLSSRLVNYNANVRISRPAPLPGGLLPSLSAYTERRGGYNAYLRTTLVGGAVTMSKAITRTIVFEAAYNLEFGHTEASETVLCFLFRACDEPTRDQLTGGDKRLAVLGARFSRDRRNNPDSASAGNFIRLDLRAANRVFFSDPSLEFSKAVIDAAWYQRIGVGVLAVRARAGRVLGGQETNGALLPPPQERLYVGGETSVRGFRQNELGPLIYVTSDDTTKALAAINAPSDSLREAFLQNELKMRIIPAGGNTMYVGNLEYRLPAPFVKSLQAVLFVDAGALSTKGVGTLKGSNQFRYTPGIALKYFSPVGPVQINVGYNSYGLLDGPAFSDQFRDAEGQSVLRCISGVEAGANNVCKSLAAISSPRGWFRRLTLSVAFPPDF